MFRLIRRTVTLKAEVFALKAHRFTRFASPDM